MLCPPLQTGIHCRELHGVCLSGREQNIQRGDLQGLMALLRSTMVVQSKSTSYIVRHSVLLSAKHHNEYNWQKQRIGEREIVGPSSGGYHFLDSTDRPYPPLRFRPDDDIIKPIREKEKGDWKKLTMDEKKLLYRYSFRRTQAELLGWNYYWKMIGAYTLVWMSIGIGLITILKHFSQPPQIPTLSDDWKNYTMRNILILEKPFREVEGASTKYDYDNDRWKD